MSISLMTLKMPQQTAGSAFTLAKFWRNFTGPKKGPLFMDNSSDVCCTAQTTVTFKPSFLSTHRIRWQTWNPLWNLQGEIFHPHTKFPNMRLHSQNKTFLLTKFCRNFTNVTAPISSSHYLLEDQINDILLTEFSLKTFYSTLRRLLKCL